jgi:hypothetical protein
MKSMRAALGEDSFAVFAASLLLGAMMAALANSIFCAWQHRDIGEIGEPNLACTGTSSREPPE